MMPGMLPALLSVVLESAMMAPTDPKKERVVWLLNGKPNCSQNRRATVHDWAIGSLFSGIGGLELGLERAGLGQTTVQVEQDKQCREWLRLHWEHAAQFPDVREVDADDLGYVEVLCGGFPCQDISAAKHNAEGITGSRSGLWSEFARAIGEVRPRIVVVENSSMLIRRGIDVVCGSLAAIGYDCEWNVVRASEVGAPHNRPRTFLVAYPHDWGTALRREWELQGHAPPDRAGLLHRGRAPAPDTRQWRSIQSPCPWLADGVPTEMAPLRRAYGNAVVPQVAEYVGGLIVSAMNPAAERETEGGA